MAKNPVKATIRILEGSPKAKDVEVMFNPSEYGIEFSSNYSEKAAPGLNNPVSQFVNGGNQVLTMDLLFDTYTDGGGSDVTKLTKPLTDILSVDDKVDRPPVVQFIWGTFSFQAIIERISQRFTMFTSEGTPVRSTLNVTFKQYRPVEDQLENPPRTSPDRSKRRVFEAHDSIWLLAAREYGDPRWWRLIATRNRIDDPRRIEPGTVLALPPLDDTTDPRGGR